MSYEIINKGKFNTPQIKNFIHLNQFIFIKEEGKKFLLLKLFNDRDEKAGGVKLLIIQKDVRGLVIDSQTVDCPLNGKPKSAFAINKKIPLFNNCVDYTVKVVSAMYGNYTYTVNNENELILSYEKAEFRKPFDLSTNKIIAGESQVAIIHNFKVPVVICIILLALFSLLSYLTYFHLQSVVADSSTFTYSGVKYSFENGDKSENSRVFVVGSEKNAKNIVIPKKLLGHEVVAISEGAFVNNSVLKKVTIEGAIEIENGAFSRCSKLSVIKMDQVTSIGDFAFQYCASLQEVNASNLSSIGSSAFFNCTSLKSIKISNENAVLKIGNNAFSSCIKLETVDINQLVDFSKNIVLFKNSLAIKTLHLKNYNYSYEFNGKQINMAHNNTLSALYGIMGSQSASLKELALKELTIDYCAAIPESFCSSIQLETVTIKNLSSPILANSAFKNCTALKELNVPLAFTYVRASALCGTAITKFNASELVEIGENAFEGSQLSTFDLKDNDSITSIGNGAFQNCALLTSFFIPETILVIKPETFQGCNSLVQISGAEQLQTIETNAFSGCASIETLDLTNNLSSIKDYAFQNCSMLKTVKVPQSVVEIGKGAFLNCAAIKEMSLPFIGKTQNSTSSSNNYFSYIFGATSASTSLNFVPKSLEKVTIKSVSEIADYAFYDCTSIKEITIESNFSRIGNNAFFSCKNLNNFVIPSTVSDIGTAAFTNCYKLYELYNLSSTLSIQSGSSDNGMAGYYALRVYSSLTALSKMPKYSFDDFEFGRDLHGNWYLLNYTGDKTSLTLPSAIIYAGATFSSYDIIQYMMIDNKTVTEIIIPNSVTAIGIDSFSGCTALTKATVSNGVLSIGAGAFFNNNSLREITLPFVGESNSSNQFFSFIFAGNSNASLVPQTLKTVTITNMNNIPYAAFYNCSQLSSINLPENLMSIGSSAFEKCSQLTTINLPENLMSIGSSAFYNCSQLTTINLPENLTSIGSSAFKNCGQLSSITLPQRITSVSESAFENCYQLSSINLPQNLSKISMSAFKNCRQLSSIILPKNLTYIDVNAFYECNSLHDVINYSNLFVVKGSETHGYVAYYAIRVSSFV